ncbi:MAG TPA: AraC family transcriptional regulator [Mobilitalea sp.]|nr:AraC family transcriptional regulator [Mobilitalea sp.]
MLFYTVGFNHYIGYIFPASVTDGLQELNRVEAKDFYKIIFIKTGPCHFLMNEKEFILTGACAICMNEKDRISFLDVQEDSAKILWFKPSIINGKFNFEVISNPNRLLSSTEHQDYYYIKQFNTEARPSMKILSLYAIDSTTIENKLQLIKELLLFQSSDSWPCRSRSYIFEILFCLARQEEDEQLANNLILYEGRSRLAIDVIYYLQTCYNQKITIEKLAEEFHTNRTTLLNDFKKYTGQSINNYLIQLRLMMASTLLRDTELPVDEICDRTGFYDISYFSKVFKKRLNHTPSEYRKINHLN